MKVLRLIKVAMRRDKIQSADIYEDHIDVVREGKFRRDVSESVPGPTCLAKALCQLTGIHIPTFRLITLQYMLRRCCIVFAEKDPVPTFDLGSLFEQVSLRNAATKVMYVDFHYYICYYHTYPCTILIYMQYLSVTSPHIKTTNR